MTNLASPRSALAEAIGATDSALAEAIGPTGSALAEEIGPTGSALVEPIGASHDILASWAALAAQSPDDPAQLLAPIQTLLVKGRPAEAGVLLDAAQFRFPDHAPFAIEAARVAQRQGAAEVALRRWQAVRDRFPGAAVGLTGTAGTLREAGRTAEAEALLTEGLARFADDPGPAIDYAWLAHDRHDWPEALRRWSVVRQHFRDQPLGYSGAADAHRHTGEFDLADALLQYALGRFPDAAWLAVEHAKVAHARRDWPEAVRRWEIGRTRVPNVVTSYTSGAAALRALGRLAEAEALLCDAADRFPAEPLVRAEQGWLAEARRDWSEAARCWNGLRARLPGEEAVYIAGARALREQGRPEEADGLLRQAIARFPDRHSPLTEHAWLAQICGDWSAAAERWAAVRQRFPDCVEAYVLAARALAELGRNDAIEALLIEGLARRPDATDIALAYAEEAERRRDWAAAIRRWGDAEARFPEEGLFLQRLHQAWQRLVESDPPPGLVPPARPAAAEPAAADEPAAAPAMAASPGAAPQSKAAAVERQVRELVAQFESLGGEMLGYEFGVFQRECGANPVGLLRWADTPYDGIVAALESRFADVGTQAKTELLVSQTGSDPGEYCTRDRRGLMSMRTFVTAKEVPFGRMYATVCRELELHARKLIEELEAGNKIFVYRLAHRTLNATELERLRAAMRSYGDTTLLYVRHEDATHPNGTVELAGPGLLVGYIDRFKVSPSGEISAALPAASWQTVCGNAWKLWHALRA